MYLILFLLTALSSEFCATVVSATELKVRGDKVVLRAAPNENSEIVSQMSAGDVLVTEKDVDGEWVEVVPPASVNFWIYGELVRDGVIVASKVQVRVGPGINYRAAGELAKDARVSVKGEYREWLKISAPPGCRLWIKRKYVDPVDKAVPPESGKESGETRKAVEKKIVRDEKPEVISPPVSNQSVSSRDPAARTGQNSKKNPAAAQGVPVTVARQQAVFSPEAAIKDKLASSKEQGRIVQYNGTLRHSGFFVWRQPSKYRLVVHDNNGIVVTLCHVLGDEKQVAPMKDREVTIHGREYWVQGVRQQVVIPDTILPKN